MPLSQPCTSLALGMALFALMALDIKAHTHDSDSQL